LLPAAPESNSAGKAVPLVQTATSDSQGQISPDGKWLAYTSVGSGPSQVYVKPFTGDGPPSDLKWQISRSTSGFGAGDPRWRADSRELYYVELLGPASTTRFMAMEIGGTPGTAGAEKSLFESRGSGLTVPLANIFLYGVTSDGQRFLSTLCRPSRRNRSN